MNAAGFSPIRLFRSVIFAPGLVAIFVALIAAYLAPDGMRRLQRWEGEVSSDLVANLLQPGRFAQIDQNLTTRFKERQPDGLLIGVFIDDRRDPSVRVTISADHRRVVKNDYGSYLLLEDGVLQRFEAKSREPAMIQFTSNTFDMSQYFNQGQNIALGVRERYIWELAAPDENDSVYKQSPGAVTR